MLVLGAIPHAHAADPPWLARLNQYRAMVHLDPVSANSSLDAGEEAHSRYLVKNYAAALRAHQPLGIDMHIEDRSNQWYSYPGFVAGRASDVLLATDAQSASWAIDSWMAAPFHRFALLNPNLSSVGFGSYCENGICAAAINVQSNATSEDTEFRRSLMSGAPITGQSEARGGGWGSRYRKAIAFPPPGSTINLLSLSGEWPDPGQGCGFTQPMGLPITIQLGWDLAPRISGGSLTENGKPVTACAFDATSYRNSDQLTQKMGRAGLQNAGAVMIVPRAPLLAGARYTVRAVIDGAIYEWSFNTPASMQHLN